MLRDEEKIVLAGSIPSSYYDDSQFADDTQRVLEAAVAKMGGDAKKIVENAKKDSGSGKYRLQMLERIGDLPKDIVSALLNKRKQLNDQVLFEVAQITGKTVRVIKTDGGKAVGVRNLSNGKHDNYFLCSAVRLMYGNGPTDYAVTYSGETYPAELENGNITIKTNDKAILNELQIAHIKTYSSDKDERRAGFYELQNPKWIYPNTEIKINIEMPQFSIPGAAWVKVMLIGTEIIDF